MNLVIKALLAKIGWQKLLIMVWGAVKPSLVEHAKKTDNDLDDSAVEVVDTIIKAVAA